MCHMINITGQILPVKKVVRLARRNNTPLLVDGVHTFSHFDFTLKDLECDYYATSLHKWLCAPHGTGMLYVRRDKIADLWPLQAPVECSMDDIRKFEEIRTHPAANCLAIGNALTFHQGIGSKCKEERLIYLRDRWAKNWRVMTASACTQAYSPVRPAEFLPYRFKELTVAPWPVTYGRNIVFLWWALST